VVNEPVDGGDGDGGVREDPIPGAEGLVGGDGEAAALIAPCDQLEEDGRLGLVLVGVGDVVEDDEVELVELGERGLEGEGEVAAGGLQPLHEVRGSRVKDAMAGFDEGMADGADEVGLAGTGVADGDEFGAGLELIAGGERFDPTFRHMRQSREVEGGEGLAAGELGLGEVPLDAPCLAFGELALCKRGEEAGGRPVFVVGALGEA